MVRACPLGQGRQGPWVVGASAVALALVLVPWLVRPALVEARLQAVPGQGALGRVDRVLALDPLDARALEVRAKLRVAAALEVWNTGRGRETRVLRSWDERRREARALLTGAAADLRTALSVTPTNPFLHEILAEVHGTTAMIDPASAPVQVPPSRWPRKTRASTGPWPCSRPASASRASGWLSGRPGRPSAAIRRCSRTWSTSSSP